MSRNTKIVVIAAAALTIAVAALALLNMGNVAELRALQESGEFIAEAGGVQYTVSIDDLEAIGPRVISANYKTNLMPAVPKQYTGVSLASLLEYLGADITGAGTVRFFAADGYVSAAPIADALDGDNCFIVYMESGKPLGTMESGGMGPYMVVFVNDIYSQRWCKYLLSVTVG
jgi:hypothetical protein